jgi:hypothetical protein
MTRRDYFEPPIQTLLAFARSDTFARRAEHLGGYDLSEGSPPKGHASPFAGQGIGGQRRVGLKALPRVDATGPCRRKPCAPALLIALNMQQAMVGQIIRPAQAQRPDRARTAA